MRNRTGASIAWGTLILLAGAATQGCHDLTNTASFPAGTADPASLRTAQGAWAMYQSALGAFTYTAVSSDTAPIQTGAFVDAMMDGGLLSDELQTNMRGCPENGSGICSDQALGLGWTYAVDGRQLPEGQVGSVIHSQDSYSALQLVRARAAQAIGALSTYAPDVPPAFRGELYALEGYAEILLADLYCSGVPLSTFDFGADFTYKPGTTTAQVYQDAVRLFDLALPLAHDSARVLNFARVGKGRALLAQGKYDSAAVAVRGVPDDFAYQFPVDWTGGGSDGSTVITRNPVSAVNARTAGFGATVADRDGGTGLPYVTAGDPRTAVTVAEANRWGVPLYVPSKYGAGVTPVTVASGLEARLIEAEASLHGVSVGRSWLSILNALRHTYAPTLPDLTDPGALDARVDVLFHERAFWLFLDGHRQGDLRRLVRQYGRDPEAVYPTGPYVVQLLQFQRYGTDVTLPIPKEEQLNPLFAGCLSRGA